MAVAGSVTYLAEIDSTKFKKELTNLKDTSKKAFEAVAKSATVVAGAMIALEQATREYRSDLSKLETNTKVANMSFDTMKDSLFDLVALTDETDSSVEALSNLMQTGFTQTGIESALESLSGAVIAFPDTLKIESLADGLQETLATGQGIGQFGELLERMGMNLDDFNDGLAEAKERGEEENYILQTLAKTGLAEVNAEYGKNNEGLLNVKKSQLEFNDAMAELATKLEPLIAQIYDFGSALLESLVGAIDEYEWLDEVLIGLVATIGGLIAALALYKTTQMAVNAITMTWKIVSGLATVATTALGAAFTFLTSPIGLVVLAIGAVIAIGYLVIKNWDAIKETAINVWNSIKEFVINIANSIMNFFKENWVQILTFIINPISGVFAFLYKFNPQFKEWVNSVIRAIGDGFKKVYDVGKNIVYGIWNGITGTANWLYNKVRSFASNIISSIKSALGIHSPSTVMRDEVGKMIPQGLAIGIEADTTQALQAVNELDQSLIDEMNKSVLLNRSGISVSGINGTVNQVLSASAKQEININNKLELDGEKVYENQQVVSARKNLQYAFV